MKAVQEEATPIAPGGSEWIDRDATKLIRQMSELLSDVKRSRELSQAINHVGEYSGDDRSGRTKLGVDELQDQIERLGVPMSPGVQRKFREMYGAGEVTLSQIQARTSAAAGQIAALGGNTAVPRADLVESSLTHKGDYVGCRQPVPTDHQRYHYYCSGTD